MNEEQWREVVPDKSYWGTRRGFPIYYCIPAIYVSDMGRIKRNGMIRPIKVNVNGYPYFSVGGESVLIHQLVCKAFLGDCPEGLEVRHLNGDKCNNQLDNLAYGTHKENMEDLFKHGTRKTARGEAKSNSKLTEEKVRQIKILAKYNTIKDLAIEFNVTRVTISDVIRGNYWKHVK